MQRSGGSHSKLPLFRDNWNLIVRGQWLAIPGTPLKVYRVDGSWIRGRKKPNGEFLCIFDDFTMGGNSEAYAWMPPDMIIIDIGMSEFDQRATLIHEMTELLAMASLNMGYEKAHSDYANVRERQFRQNPEAFQSLWGALVGEYKTYFAKHDGKADRVGLSVVR